MSLKKKFYLVVLCVLTIALFAGCGEKPESTSDSENADGLTPDASTFDFSAGFDKDGMWKDVRALDIVELLDYKNIEIPVDIHTVHEEDIDAQIDSLLASHMTSEDITDRAVVDGDTINIDYVGSVDGVEFDGGTTNGAGSEVTIGVTNFIDDFLEQLIGHMPGENFDINVTFPEDYHAEDLKGKDAVFNVTINYIVESFAPELTDDFVAENFSEVSGWTTVSELTDGIRSNLQKNAIAKYLQEYILSNSTVETVPDSVFDYNEELMINYYAENAASYGVDLDEFLATYIGVSTIEELKEKEYDGNVDVCKYTLVIQAIAEDSDILLSNEELASYFEENAGSSDYSTYEDEYGLPYIKHIVMEGVVMNLLQENVTLL